MKVTVVDRARESALWGRGYRSIQQVITTIEIADTCPTCGGPRGESHLERYCEDGEWYTVSRWTNPCGHLDTYRQVLEEARELQS